MRNWLLIIILGLSNLALAQAPELDSGLMNIFNILAANDQVEHFSAERLQSMNAALQHLEAKFRVTEQSEYQAETIKGVRYVIKNISLEPIVVAKEFATDEKLLALMVSNNLLAADASAIVYVLKEIK